ncbi:hypothetical protein B566_EDAN004450 [Ephemera danica]|nr:hypothetical protein B566_EDAN004450 [Ephemera danica]
MCECVPPCSPPPGQQQQRTSATTVAVSVCPARRAARSESAHHYTSSPLAAAAAARSFSRPALMAAAAAAASSAAVATRAALVRLALLLLIQQLQPVVANVRDIPEAVKKDNSEALQNSRFTTTTPEPHNQQHHSHSGHGHRGVHPGARLNGAQLASTRKLMAESPESPMDRRVHDEGGPNIRKSQDDISDMLQPLEMTNNKSISGEHHLAPPIITTDIVPPPSSSGTSGHHANHTSGCSTCRIRQELRNMSLLVIKEQILNKLGLKHAPNITGRAIPKIPPLHHLFDRYGVQGMQGDQPDRFFQPGPMKFEEDDDFHSKTTMVIAVAQTWLRNIFGYKQHT